MEHNTNPQCLHEEQIQSNSRKIERLEARADYKDTRLDNFEKELRTMNKKMDDLSETVIQSQKETLRIINDLQLQSKNDDYNMDKRLTSLETTVQVLKWVTSALLAVIPILIALRIIS